jgi:hypothetical protein
VITEILAKRDNAEILAEEIAAILAIEAGPASEIRVYLERSDPWAPFVDAPPQTDADAKPIVNVSYDSGTFDERRSNVVERQHTTSVFHIDCYGYGASEDDKHTGGQVVGDVRAAAEVKKAVRIVRNILMSAKYVVLGQRGMVARRWVQSIQLFRPAQDARPVQRVIGARVTFHVDHNEFSPQVEGVPLTLISTTVKRAVDGRIYFRSDIQPVA